MASPTIANTDQASAWDGDDGDYWVVNEARYEAMLRDYSTHLLEAAAIRPGENVLDVGCGCGGSSRAAARSARPGQVLGVDLSGKMLTRARERARDEQLTHLRFEQADAQVNVFPAESVDLVLSRFGAMFFNDPAAAFRNLQRSLRPGGRLALLTWQGLERNEWIREIRHVLAGGRPVPAPPLCAPGPLGLSDPEAVRKVLSQAGFAQIELIAVSGPLRYGTAIEEAFEFVRGTPLASDLLADLDATNRKRTVDALRDLLARHRTDDGVSFQSSAWIVTARAG